VRDEDHREAERLPEVEQEPQDLGLDRHVEGGQGLVGEQELRLHGEGPGDADPLPLAARELARVLVRVGRSEPHLHEQPLHPPGALGRGVDLMDVEDLAQGATHALARVERRVGVLEDDLHALPVGGESRFGEREQVDAVEAHLAGVGVVEPEDAAGERALAAAGLADQPQRPAARQAERDPVDRPNPFGRSPQGRVEERVGQREVLDEIADLQERARGLSHRGTPP
jgi:hypothetical protein